LANSLSVDLRVLTTQRAPDPSLLSLKRENWKVTTKMTLEGVELMKRNNRRKSENNGYLQL